MARKNADFWQSKIRNDMTFLYYYRKIIELGAASIKYADCPLTINQRYLQLALITDGRALLFEDEDLGYLGLRVAPSGSFDQYGEPLRRRAYGVNGYRAERDEKNSVLIYNNYMRASSIPDVNLFASKLAAIDRTIEINVNAQKTPLLIQCPEEARLSLINMYEQYNGNVPVIYGTKGLDPSMIKAYSSNAPYVAGQLYDLKTKIWNEVLTYWGIANISYTKKERMVTDEVNRGMGGVMANRVVRLNEQIAALEKFNALFGTKIVPYFDDNCVECEDNLLEQAPAESEVDENAVR